MTEESLRLSENPYDVFISYRRKTGVNDARLLQQALRTRGYNVFFDFDSLRDGKFDDRILCAIEAAQVFVLMLTEDSLDKCSEDGDWVRMEIEHAIKTGKKIVPVRPSDQAFEFPADLPDSIARVAKEQISELNKEALFEESVDKIVQDRFPSGLEPKPVSKRAKRRLWPLPCIGLALVVCLGGIGAWVWSDSLFPYPVTARQRGMVDTLAGYMMLLCTAYNDYLSAESGLINAAEIAVSTGKMESFHETSLDYFRHVKRSRAQGEKAASEITSFIKQFRSMPIDYAGIPIFLESMRTELEEANQAVSSLEHVCDRKYPCKLADRMTAVKSFREEMSVRSDLFSFMVMGVFCNISDSALSEFRKACEQWTSLGALSGKWLRGEKEIESKGNALCNRLEEIIRERTALVGAKNRELAADAEKFLQQMQAAGMSGEDAQKMLGVNSTYATMMAELRVLGKLPEEQVALYRRQLIEAGATTNQADAQIAKLREMAEVKKKLSEAQTGLAEARGKMREKFAPTGEDDVGMLWGKALRFMSVKMPEDAKLCIDELRRRRSPEFPTAALDVAEAILLAKDPLPFAGGVLVCSYEPPATSHAIYNVGDVIAEVNGKPCMRYEDYRGKAGNTYTVYRRNAKGRFEKLAKVMPENQPRVALVNLIEEPRQ